MNNNDLLITRMLVEKDFDPSIIYPAKFISSFKEVFRKFAVVDLVSPIASIIRGFAYDVKKIYDVSFISPFTEITDDANSIVHSTWWEELWGNALWNMLVYGKACIRISVTDTGQPLFYILPYDTATESNPITLELLRCSGVYKNVINNWSFEYTTERIYEVTDGKVSLDVTNDFGYVPVVCLRSPVATMYPDSPPPITAPAIQLSIVATQLINDVVILAHLQSFSILKIVGAELFGADAGQINISPYYSLLLPDGANAEFITPSSRIDNVDAIIDNMMVRAAILCGLPPDIFRHEAGTSGTSAMMAQRRYAPAISLGNRIRRSIIAAMRRALAMYFAINYGYDLVSVDNALQFDVRFEGDAIAPASITEVESWKRAIDYKLVNFETARRYFNPDELPEKTREAMNEYETELNNSQNMIVDYERQASLIGAE